MWQRSAAGKLFQLEQFATGTVCRLEQFAGCTAGRRGLRTVQNATKDTFV